MTMSRLSKLYETMENLKELGLSINDDLIQEANQLEEDIIKKDILPVLTKTIEPALKPVKRELVLVVDYVPGKPLSVHLSRKSNITAELPDAKEIVLDPEVQHGSWETHSEEKHTRGGRKILTIKFPDGSVIEESNAAQTLVSFVKRIGVLRVRKVVEEYELKFNGVPVVSNRRDAKYGNTQKDLGNGWLLITHSNNPTKKHFIEQVSEALNLGLKVTLKE